MNAWPLLGIAIVVAGFALRLNAVPVVVVAALASALLAGRTPTEALALLGEGFAKNRFLLVFVLTLPVIGLLERGGLRAEAEALVQRLRALTSARLLLVYHAVRQLGAALGLVSLGGHAQTVRPLLAPMLEGAARRDHGELPEATRARLRALGAATDNVALFFGEDLFLAFGAVLLMQSVLAEHGHVVTPLAIAMWGIPTALAAFAIHATRLSRLEGRLRREARAIGQAAPSREAGP